MSGAVTDRRRCAREERVARRGVRPAGRRRGIGGCGLTRAAYGNTTHHTGGPMARFFRRRSSAVHGLGRRAHRLQDLARSRATSPRPARSSRAASPRTRSNYQRQASRRDQARALPRAAAVHGPALSSRGRRAAREPRERRHETHVRKLDRCHPGAAVFLTGLPGLPAAVRPGFCVLSAGRRSGPRGAGGGARGTVCWWRGATACCSGSRCGPSAGRRRSG